MRRAETHPDPAEPSSATTDEQTPTDSRRVLIVDAANVVGSVPDGWWRDRRGATARLRDRLAPLAESGIAGLRPPVHIVLVAEGRARGVETTLQVTVVDAPAAGDDTIVDLVRTDRDHTVIVVTADRELRRRVTALGALTVGPSTIPRPECR